MKSLSALALFVAALLSVPAAASADGEEASNVSQTHTIVQIAAADGRFDTLVAAVKAAGLAETLSGDGPFTLFAPTDAAFNALPAGTVESLLQPENRDQLVSILTYHVVAGRIESRDLLSAGSANTASGATLPIGLSIGGATIVQTDIKAENGIIHVIDAVLLPPADPSTAAAAMSPAETRTAREAREVIMLAVDRGAPLYNMG
ncbi:MAG: fasciclin domain-containing protein, partial [Rhodothermales bacterium]|nr:fasciclin domain-containing protein [Rhodothermales bacterium]